MSEQVSNVRWVDTDEGIKTQQIYNRWLVSKLGDDFDLNLHRSCELQCDFFHEKLDTLELSESGTKEVFRIWEAAAQYLEGEYIRNIVRHAL